MNTIDHIKMSLENSKNWAMGLISDMNDNPLVQPTPNGGNHPLWVLGHVSRAESDLLLLCINKKDGSVLWKAQLASYNKGEEA